MSIAVLVSAFDTCVAVSARFFDCTSAAIAAACGAAADVPKNDVNAGTLVLTPSSAVISGLFRTVPPLEVKLPGVIGAPFARKNTRRKPSELNVSTLLDPTNVVVHGPIDPAPAQAGVAATLKVLAVPVVACPGGSPPAAPASRPRFVARCRNTPLPENFTITSRSPVAGA